MSWRSVYEAQHGSIAALFVVEGLPYCFATGAESFDDINSVAGAQYPVQIDGALSKEGLEWTHEVDFKNCELKSSGITFKLLDVDYQPGGVGTAITKWKVTELMAGREAAIDYSLGADVAAGAAVVQLNTIAGLAASGDVYLNLETIHYTGTAGGPPRLTGCTKGYYYSADESHEYEPTPGGAPGGDEEPQAALVPRVGTRPVSWIGRRCRLYLAEILPTGALANANLVWRGRVMTDIQLAADGASWEVHAQSAIDAQNTQIPAVTPSTSLRGILLDDANLDWYATEVATGIITSGSVTLPATTYVTMDQLCADLTDQINTALAATAVSTRYDVAVEGGVVVFRQIIPEFAAGAYRVRLRLWGRILSGLLTDDWSGNTSMELPPNGQPDYGPRAASAAARVTLADGGTVRVSNASRFVAIDSVGDGYDVKSVVVIGDRNFWLRAVNSGTRTLTIQPARALVGEDGIEVSHIVEYVGDRPLEVKEGLMLFGRAMTYWRDGFLDNSAVPTEWKGGLRSSDFDWTEMADIIDGGASSLRYRFLLEPQSFRDLLLEDMRWSGLVPSVSTGTGALISARKLRAPTLRAAVATVDSRFWRSGEIPQPRRSQGLIVNDVTVINAWQSFTATAEKSPAWTYRIPCRESIALYGMVQKIEIKTSGSHMVSPEEVGEHAYALAQQYFSVFGFEHWLVTQPCTIRAAGIRPGEVVGYAHWVAPNGLTRGIDEDTPVMALVTAVHVAPFQAKCDLGLFWLVDGTRRSGFHLAARITAKTDRGAGTEPNRYALTFVPQTYTTEAPPGSADGVAANEGPWFDLFASTIWVLEEWDDDSAPATESVTLSTDPYNVAVGNFIFVTAMPASDPTVGTWILRPPAYGAGPTTALQREFLHIASEASGGLFSNGAAGFKPA